jgi:hypothetical protein
VLFYILITADDRGSDNQMCLLQFFSQRFASLRGSGKQRDQD